MSLAPLVHPCKSSGGCIMFVLAQGCFASQSRLCSHRIASPNSCSASHRNLGRPTSARLCGPLVTYYVRHLVWLRAARL